MSGFCGSMATAWIVPPSGPLVVQTPTPAWAPRRPPSKTTAASAGPARSIRRIVFALIWVIGALLQALTSETAAGPRRGVIAVVMVRPDCAGRGRELRSRARLGVRELCAHALLSFARLLLPYGAVL